MVLVKVILAIMQNIPLQVMMKLLLLHIDMVVVLQVEILLLYVGQTQVGMVMVKQRK